MIKAIFFDYHGVLDKHNFQQMLEILAKGSFKQGDFNVYRQSFFEKYAVLCNSYSSGQILPEHFWSKLLKDGLDIDLLSKARDYILTIEKNQTLIKQINLLKARFELGILSDCPLDKLEFLKHSWQLKRYFKYTIFSSEITLDKQDPEYYLEMTHQTKYQRSEIFYIDENPENVNLAKKLGFETALYNDDINLVKYFN
jgi:putative hydrolase of the HAD superfamily